MKIKGLKIFNFLNLINFDNLLTLKDLKLVLYMFKKIDVHEKNALNGLFLILKLIRCSFSKLRFTISFVYEINNKSINKKNNDCI